MSVKLILWIVICVVFSLQFYLICVHILALFFIYNIVSHYISCTGVDSCEFPHSVDEEDILCSLGFLEEKISNKALFIFYSFICLVISDFICPFLGTERHRGIKASHWDSNLSKFQIELIHAGCFVFQLGFDVNSHDQKKKKKHFEHIDIHVFFSYSNIKWLGKKITNTVFCMTSLVPNTAQSGFLHLFQYCLSYALALEKLGVRFWIWQCLGKWKY